MTFLDNLLKKPENIYANVWRYMDIAKFLSLLERKELFLPTGQTLRQVDKFEGSIPLKNFEARKIKPQHIPDELWKLMGNYLGGKSEVFANLILISCWHMNEYESAAMWDIYSDKGIAIKTSFSNLIKAFPTISSSALTAGLVNYIDYQDILTYIPETNGFAEFAFKRKSFQHESEIRLLTILPNEYLEKTGEYAGVYIPVDLALLIQTIYISPHAPSWFFELIEAIVKRYGLNVRVQYSDLKSDPIY